MQTHREISSRLRVDLASIERIAWWMDDKFRLRGTQLRFGLDPLINLVPFLGDIIGFAISFYLVLIMWRHGASRKLVMLMLINVIIDLTLGVIPVIGNVFDFFFKANRKNILLLQQYYYEGKHRGSGNDILTIALGIFLLLAFVLVYLLWLGFLWMINLW